MTSLALVATSQSWPVVWLWQAVILDEVGLHTRNWHHCFDFTLPFNKRCPSKRAYDKTSLDPISGTANIFIVRPFFMRSALFLTVGENKSNGTIYMTVREPYLKWQPVKTGQLVNLDRPPSWLGVSLTSCLSVIIFLVIRNFHNRVSQVTS